MTKSFNLPYALMLLPVLSVSDTLVRALVCWMLWVVTVTIYGLSMSLVRHRLSGLRPLMASVLLAATWVSCAHLAMQVLALNVSADLNVYLMLIGVQCVLLEQEGFFLPGSGKLRLRLFAAFGLLMLVMVLLRSLINSNITTLAPGGFILLALLLAAWQAWPQPSKPH
ncbi:hypothetical protein OOJ96_01055 [Pseudomonas sp. 15FMM2]|uniref:Uncharacterized protein n=1 Tax=Pseudomonas imrae TaxID=2992837 RepID=A0ACC7P8V9_9PSED